METQEKSPAKQIVRAPSQALAVRSAALVARGLRDLARDSNWLIKKVFTGRSPQLVISPAGELCALSPLVRQGAERIALYDIERGVPTLALVVPGEPDMCPPGLPAAFAWSPTARHLVAAWGGWLPELHVFDLHGKVFLGGFGDFKSFPSFVVLVGHRKIFCGGFARGRGSAAAVVAGVRAIAGCHAVCRRTGCRASLRPAQAKIGSRLKRWTLNPATRDRSQASAASRSARTNRRSHAPSKWKGSGPTIRSFCWTCPRCESNALFPRRAALRTSRGRPTAAS